MRKPIDGERVLAIAREAASVSLQAGLPELRKRRPPTKQRVEQVKLDVAAMIASKDFSKATAMDLVALWAHCHEKAYGIAPALSTREWQHAAMFAGKLAKERFEGKPYKAVPFIAWTWREEEKSLEWRRRNGRQINPLGWRLQFSERHLVKWLANKEARA
jgi:hypothetical protein